MARTRHGHHIPGTVIDTEPPKSVARCGGPLCCPQCKQDAGLAAGRRVADKIDAKEKPDASR